MAHQHFQIFSTMKFYFCVLFCKYCDINYFSFSVLYVDNFIFQAVAWCPWQNNLLATGGGTADRTIRLWNCTTGICLKDTTTNSQVSSIVWSAHYKEFISGHGFSNNQLTIWKYPSMAKVADLTGHTGRVLELCVSPDGQMVVSAAADETIRMWKCWAMDKKDKKQADANKGHPISMLAQTIR
ncbi:cell division cycle protein 20 homolog [Penaeus monodon]|uniref:cell division cycle protein 20 homolog n=1 Tax=Penaeus monodon TaxID=6687 RepID=UPI0018A7186E|nr:cell division cycle protein 20 homolog [Penaeus monodon]